LVASVAAAGSVQASLAMAVIGFQLWVSLIGVYGFAYRKAIISRLFWRIWLPIAVGLHISSEVWASDGALAPTVGSFIIGGPAYVIIASYGWREFNKRGE
jgi:hypothetical protein